MEEEGASGGEGNGGRGKTGGWWMRAVTNVLTDKTKFGTALIKSRAAVATRHVLWEMRIRVMVRVLGGRR